MAEAEAPHLSFAPLGDRALLIEAGDVIDPATTARVASVAARISGDPPPGVSDIVPAFCSVALHYDPEALRAEAKDRAPYDAMVERLQALLMDLDSAEPFEGRVFEIPVVYGGEHGEDLAWLAQTCGLTEEKVVEIHSGATYFAFSTGFAPGFAYLGTVDPQLRQPRRDKPRVRVPSGSVALANGFTGVYPLELPGGWHLVGRTPWQLFDVEREPPALLAAGDRVRFRPIPATQFASAARTQPWR
jgi:inhibitor of KinA